MKIWLVLMISGDSANDVSIMEGFETYEKARENILRKNKNLANMGDFVFVDTENKIIYKIQTVDIN